MIEDPINFETFMSSSGFDDFTTMFGRDDEFGAGMDQWLNDFPAGL